ncbi:TlyA family RNA methyltransferase [Brevundimonas sp. R86498]|uniref:TlyA family RNA methyltransferase n=1 Tax=Brevundimonas sp. R86498 TaxID=3093845 RepID=UPI0037C883F0
MALGDFGPRTRLDHLLVSQGLVESRSRAQAAIKAGGVTVDGQPARAASQGVSADAVLTLVEAHGWVGRGGVKLDHALTVWPVAVDGRVVLDVGASTGGFTEVCLARGAARVFAVDVGSGQMSAKISADPRVVSLEQTDVRTLDADLIPDAPDLIVCDVSFIGLAKALPAALALAGPGADLVVLVKPQFEGDGPSDAGKKGVVKDPDARDGAVQRVSDWLSGLGWTVQGTAESPITGGDGNVEFLLWARRA